MFETELISKLFGKISPSDLELVKQAVQMTAVNYDIQPKSTAIVECNGGIPEEVKYYLASRHIEGLSDKTIKRYSSALVMFFTNVDKPIKDINTNDVRVHLFNLQSSGRQQNATLDGTRGILNTFFDWCVNEGYVDKNPVKLIRPIRYEKKERRYMTDDELERVRDACSDITESALVEFLYSTGCRVEELTKLTLNDINFSTHEVKLFGKGNKHRTSYMNAKCEYTLRKYLTMRDDDSKYLFVGRRKPHSGYSIRAIQVIIEKLGKRAGLSYKLMPHIFRHTTATHALQHGMDITEIQKLLGHSKLDTTMIYAKTSQESVKANHHKYVI